MDTQENLDKDTTSCYNYPANASQAALQQQQSTTTLSSQANQTTASPQQSPSGTTTVASTSTPSTSGTFYWNPTGPSTGNISNNPLSNHVPYTYINTTTNLYTPDQQVDLNKNYVSRIVRRYNNKYFYSISVSLTDNVYYRVWKGGIFPFICAKLFRYSFSDDIKGNQSIWSMMKKRSHLPATIGAAYETIDQMIKNDIKERDHKVYIKGLLKTHPENLKMISGLETLQEGTVSSAAPQGPPNISVGL